MRGVVIARNPRRGMFAVRCEDDNTTVFELLDSTEPEVGDVVEGDLRSLGGERLRLAEARTEINVFIENIDIPKGQIRQQLLL